MATSKWGAFVRRSYKLTLGVGLLTSFAACTGEFGPPMGRSDRPGGSPTTTGGPGATGPGTSGGTTGGTTTGGTMGPSGLLGLPPAVTPAARIHKLTAVEFTNSVHDLLG